MCVPPFEAMFEEELAEFLGRLRYGRGNERAKGYRHGHRDRQLTGTFGTETVRVPRARIENEAGKITEWRSKALPRYRRLTKKAEALIAAVYPARVGAGQVDRRDQGLGLLRQPPVAGQCLRSPFGDLAGFVLDPSTRNSHRLGAECAGQLPLAVPVAVTLARSSLRL